MRKNKFKIFIACILTLLTVCMIGFIFFQSTLPAVDSSRESGRVVTFLNKLATFVGLGEIFTQNFVRKCAHLTEFAVLGILTASTLINYNLNRKLCIWTAPCLCFVVAVADETLQLFSPGRSFQLTDICIDTAGGIMGTIVLLFILVIFIDKSKRMNKSHGKS